MRKITDSQDIAFEKFSDGLVPCIVQDASSFQVLMLGYMSKAAYETSIEIGNLTFFSRSKGRLWTKGEESGNVLRIQSLSIDCDQDAILALVHPVGPTCHTGETSCWGNANIENQPFIHYLESVVQERLSGTQAESYTYKLYQSGIPKVAQKVGEEAVETVIEAVKGDLDLFKAECADLLFHTLVLIQSLGLQLDDVLEILKKRHQK